MKQLNKSKSRGHTTGAKDNAKAKERVKASMQHKTVYGIDSVNRLGSPGHDSSLAIRTVYSLPPAKPFCRFRYSCNSLRVRSLVVSKRAAYISSETRALARKKIVAVTSLDTLPKARALQSCFVAVRVPQHRTQHRGFARAGVVAHPRGDHAGYHAVLQRLVSGQTVLNAPSLVPL